MSFRVFFHHGPELGLTTSVAKGRMEMDDNSIIILDNGKPTQISFNEIEDVQLIRLHKIGRVIRLEHANGTLFVSVVRFMIGQFAVINFLATGTVFKRIRRAIDCEAGAI